MGLGAAGAPHDDGVQPACGPFAEANDLKLSEPVAKADARMLGDEASFRAGVHF